MAGRTVIDEMIVKLGLDPRDFTKGQKEAAASVSNTEKSVQKSAGGMSRQLTGLAAKWLSFAGAIYAIKKAVTIIDDVAERTRKLGVDAKNYGIAAAGLRNFENAVEMFGGTAADARKSIDGINQAVFDMAYNGQMSDSLIMLARLGVQFQTATGEARDFNSIVLDTADAIGKAQEQGMSRASAVQYLRQAGFDEGTSQMILAGRAQAEAALAAQDKRRQVSDSDVSAATEIVQSRTGRRQAWHGGEIEFMQSPAGKAVEAINQAAEELLTPMGAAQAAAKVTGKVTDAMEGMVNKIKEVGGAFDGLLSRLAPKGRAAYESVIQSAAAANNISPDLLAGVLATESNFDPAAVNKKSGAKGIAQLMQSSFPDRVVGVNPDNDIRTAAEYLAQLGKEAGGNWDLALQMYNAGPTRMKNAGKPGAKPLSDETLNYPSKVWDYVENNGNSANPTPGAQAGTTYSKTEVQIDNITVQTRATDAEGIADGLDGSVKRKLLASHAEQGMQ